MTAAPALDLPPPWGLHQVPEQAPLPLRIGPRDLWLQRHAGEIRVARGDEPGVNGAGQPGSPSPRPPDDAAWSRWATPAGEHEVRLHPTLPDRTVVLGPESPFRLLPGAEARVYVRVPLRMRLELRAAGPEGGDLVLEEIPVVGLSDTWWGSFMEGELAYWLPTTARREMRPELYLPHLVVCPLQLVNRSAAALQVEKLAFRVAHLSLFVHDGHFWGDEAKVTYQGLVEGSQIEMAGRCPREAPGGERVAPPRTPLLKGFRARTFHRLLSLPGMGGAF